MPPLAPVYYSATPFKDAVVRSDTDYSKLRRRIVEAATAWQGKDVKPPASVAQLAIMALVLDQAPMTPKSVSHWICEHFVYYKGLAYDLLWSTADYRRSAPNDAYHFEQQLDEVFRLYEIPLRAIAAVKTVRYSIGTFDAKRILSDVLCEDGDRDKTIFDFFKLPAELRNEIYGYAYVFPKPGLMLPSTPNERASVLSRDLDDTAAFVQIDNSSAPRTPSKELLRTPTITSMLSSMCANKQFRKEALPIFYGSNKLFFTSHHEMFSRLKKIPSKHRGHISFDYGYNPDRARIHFRVFEDGTLPNLAKLEMFYDETRYRRKSITTMPGFSSLRRLKGLEEVKFHECPTIEKLLKAGMEKSKTDTSPLAGGEKKRKNAVKGEVNGGGAAKKVKKSKSE